MFKRKLEIRIVGGLGNQLFVYFAGLYLSRISDRELVLDMSDKSRNHSAYDLLSFEEISGVKTKNKSKFYKTKLKKIQDSYRYRASRLSIITDTMQGIHSDRGFEMNKVLVRSKRRIIKLSGYFQDFNYINNLDEVSLTLDSETKAQKRKYSNTLAIHIRRGDFVFEKQNHGCLTTSWYLTAVKYILNLYPELNEIRIFSNDTEWIRCNLGSIIPNLNKTLEIVEFDSLKDPAVDFLEFASCGYRICSNSTYSLLASRLLSGVTIVPYPYNRSGNFRALEESSPANWIRIPSIWED
jgi:hypothetical protein